MLFLAFVAPAGMVLLWMRRGYTYEERIRLTLLSLFGTLTQFCLLLAIVR